MEVMVYMGIRDSTDWARVILVACDRTLHFQPCVFALIFSTTLSNMCFLLLLSARGRPRYLDDGSPSSNPLKLHRLLLRSVLRLWLNKIEDF